MSWSLVCSSFNLGEGENILDDALYLLSPRTGGYGDIVHPKAIVTVLRCFTVLFPLHLNILFGTGLPAYLWNKLCTAMLCEPLSRYVLYHVWISKTFIIPNNSCYAWYVLMPLKAAFYCRCYKLLSRFSCVNFQIVIRCIFLKKNL